MSEQNPEKLWREYKAPFSTMDDLSLARWLSQTLGQFEGQLWRASHPLVAAYRLAADEARERELWGKRLAGIPGSFHFADCCGAPLFPYFTRDVLTTGLLCNHCGQTTVPLEEIPDDVRKPVQKWAEEYQKIHAVAHWGETEQALDDDYEETLDQAADSAELMLKNAGSKMLPRLLEFYPALVWEDQDECLEVLPEDIQLT